MSGDAALQLSLRLEEEACVPPGVISGELGWLATAGCIVRDAYAFAETRFRYRIGLGSQEMYGRWSVVLHEDGYAEPGHARRHAAQVALEGEFQNGQRGIRPLRLPLMRAYPTLDTDALHVRTIVRVVAVLGDGQFVETETPITTLAPATGFSAFEQTPVPTIYHPEYTHFSIGVVSRRGRPGETLEGSVEIRPVRDFTAREIRLGMVRSEQSAPLGNGQRDDINVVRGQQTLAENVILHKAEPQLYPFRVTIPPDAVPTCVTGLLANVRWVVACEVVPRRSPLSRRRSRQRTQLEIKVYNAPDSAPFTQL